MEEFYKKILIPVDGSILADLAYQKAKRYAKSTNAELVILSIVDTTVFSFQGIDYAPEVSRMVDEAEQFVADYAKDAEKEHLRYKTLTKVGTPKGTILDLVKDPNQKFDAIFMGASGTNSLTRLIIGSTTEFVVRFAPVDVLVVRTHMDNHTRPTH
ncbi:universal stress protein [Enterococcus hirae]|jgi:nucleotide-binding universal stress UspA family protein|nr:universal stress protein [Enterococcaceae bacterium]MCI1919603.1 universal stress protein [Enterococcaceae bacterium]MDM8213474.1 universal stress protein [Enterococcus hirae]